MEWNGGNVDAVLFPVGYRILRGNFAGNFGMIGLNLLEGRTRILQNLLEFAVFQIQPGRLAKRKPVKPADQGEEKQKPGTVSKPTSSLVALFLPQSRLLGVSGKEETRRRGESRP